ncbi:hypothetical protein [Oceanicoccus sp. KOV_DT_Chl]|uniref:hypothetical protein n=1 Tax=Oceanicoccus sp. KOV_DT_Chl TaxID=1904639 RepID=UPI000C7A5F17|nr:hypothetical protein [Oceanicoccus sp. KOV_DT_Chl]
MINFPVNNAVNTPASSSLAKANSRRIVPSSAADKRDILAADRRFKRDRRGRRGSKQVMDRRAGADRRRSSIDFSV